MLATVLLLMAPTQTTESVKSYGPIVGTNYWNYETVPLDQFDPNMGTLVGITLEFRQSCIKAERQWENRNPNSSCSVAWGSHVSNCSTYDPQAYSDMEIQAFDGSSWVTIVTHTAVADPTCAFTLAPFDGVDDFQGTSGVTWHPNDCESWLTPVTITDPFIIREMVGSGTFDVRVRVSPTSYGTSENTCAPESAGMSNEFTGNVAVVYEYQ